MRMLDFHCKITLIYKEKEISILYNRANKNTVDETPATWVVAFNGVLGVLQNIINQYINVKVKLC